MWKFLVVCHYLAKFDGHRPCGNSDIADLIFHVIFQDQVVRGPCVYGRKLLIVYPHHAKFGSHRHCGRGYIMILVCHVISEDHIVICSCNFMGKSLSK